MGVATARRVMMVLLLAGVALALSTQGAAARHASSATTALVNGDRWPRQPIVQVQSSHRFVGQRAHRSGFRDFHPMQRHSRHAFHGFKRHDSNNVAVRIFQRSAAHHAGFHSGRVFHSGRGFHKPPHHAHTRHSFEHGFKAPHSFKAPRIIVVDPTGVRRAGSHSVVVVRGGGAHSFTGGKVLGAPGGGKLIVLPSSPHFKHIIVGK